jgi:hypothetical protein
LFYGCVSMVMNAMKWGGKGAREGGVATFLKPVQKVICIRIRECLGVSEDHRRHHRVL